MKDFKKLLALFLAFALVIGVFSTPKAAYAAETNDSLITTDKVTIDYENEKISVTKTSQQDIYFTMKYSATAPTKAVWEEAYVASSTVATIDFSNTSATKDVDFYITEDKTKTPLKVTVKAQESTLAVGFSGVAKTTATSKTKVENDWTALNALTAGYDDFTTDGGQPWSYGYLTVTTTNKATKTKVAMTADEADKYLEFRKGTTGAWKSIKDLDLRKFTAYGATLYFRIAAENDTTATVTGGAITTLGRASKEVKVKYAKQASAPKVTVVGATKQIKLAKTQEYRTFTTSGGNRTYGDWITVKDNHMTGTKVNVVTLGGLYVSTGSAWTYNENTAGQGVQLRTAASEKGASSKVTTVELNAATTPVVSTSAGIGFELVKSTTYAKGIKVTVTTGTAVQVAVVSGTSFDVNNSKQVKWYTISKGKYKVLSAKDLAKGNDIIYRTATIKDVKSTPANEFVVSSAFGTYDYKTNLPLAPQTFTLGNATATATVTTASVSAIVAASTVTVTNSASPSAITVIVDVTTKNIIAGTPTVVAVTEATDTAPTTTASKVKLAANGAFTGTLDAGTGKLKITIASDAVTETKIFRVTLDGNKAYVTVKFEKQ